MDDSSNINQYLTADEAVQLLGCSKRTLRRYVSQGLIGKNGRGKKAKYSGMSVFMLKGNKGKGKIDKVLDQLKIVVDTQKAILARLTLLESIFMPRGGTIDLDKPTAELLRSSIKATYLKNITFEDCSLWVEDLLRLSEKSCKKLGYKELAQFTEFLLAFSHSLDEVKRKPKNRILVERLRWFRSRLKAYSSLATSEVLEHQDGDEVY